MDQLHRDIIDLQRRWHDRLDDATHTVAREISSAIQRLEDDIQVKKNVRTLEDQVKHIIQKLESLKGTVAMSQGHLGEFQQGFERMRASLQRLG